MDQFLKLSLNDARMVALMLVLNRLDQFIGDGSPEAAIADASMDVDALLTVATDRAEVMTKSYDKDETPETLASFDHRAGAASFSWVDGFLAGVRWNRVCTTKKDTR